MKKTATKKQSHKFVNHETKKSNRKNVIIYFVFTHCNKLYD